MTTKTPDDMTFEKLIDGLGGTVDRPSLDSAETALEEPTTVQEHRQDDVPTVRIRPEHQGNSSQD